MPFIEENQEETITIGLYYCPIIKSLTTADNYELFTDYFKSMWVKI